MYTRFWAVVNVLNPLCNPIKIAVPNSRTGAPGAIPTRDLSLRRRTLYAAELREHTG